MSYGYKIDNIMADIVNDEGLLERLVPHIINDELFHRAVFDAVIGSNGERFVHLCERYAYSMALEMDQKERNI